MAKQKKKGGGDADRFTLGEKKGTFEGPGKKRGGFGGWY